MKRLLFVISMIFFMSFPAYADTKQIPARPSVNTEYYQYYALFYERYDKEYYLIYSPKPIVMGSNGDTYIGFWWNPDTSDAWQQLTYVTNSVVLWGYLTHLSSNGNVTDLSGNTIEAADEVVFREHAKANFSAYSDYWDNSGGGGGDGDGDGGESNAGIISGLRSVVNAITSLPAKIGNAILSILQSLFIPADGFLEEKINYISDRFKVAFGITPYDMSSMFSAEKALNDISITIYGATATVVEMDYVMEALAVFRKIIRGFICFLLLFYNINQFLGLIGQAPMTLGALIGIRKQGQPADE